MNWNFNNDRPIYIQLVEKLKLSIISKAYVPGTRLPSVRDLAFESKVNPNTMQKALTELESIGLIYTERTNGKFVTDNINLIDNVKNELAKSKVDVYLHDMQSLGFTKDEATKYLKESRKGE